MTTETQTNEHSDWGAYDAAQDAATPQPLQTIALKVVTLARRAYQLDEMETRKDENDPFGWISLGTLRARGDDEQLARRQLAAFLDNLPGQRKRQLRTLMAFGRLEVTDLAQFYREAGVYLEDDATACKHQGVSLERTEALAYNLYRGLKRADDLGLDLDTLFP